MHYIDLVELFRKYLDIARNNIYLGQTYFSFQIVFMYERVVLLQSV